MERIRQEPAVDFIERDSVVYTQDKELGAPWVSEVCYALKEGLWLMTRDWSSRVLLAYPTARSSVSPPLASTSTT